MRLINPQLITIPNRGPDKEYKLFPYLLIGCFIETKVSKTGEMAEYYTTADHIYVYPNYMETRKMNNRTCLEEITRQGGITKGIKEMINKAGRKPKDSKREYNPDPRTNRCFKSELDTSNRAKKQLKKNG